MRYRRIVDGEPQFGQSQKDFAQGMEAVSQAICTRLKLFTNEWWENLQDGLPLWTLMIGQGGNGNKNMISSLITARILDTKLDDLKLVSGMSNVSFSFDGESRNFSYTGTAISIYGEITITNNGG